jgi:hypothetical protein
MYQLSTKAVFCSDSEIKYEADGMSIAVNGLLSVTGDPNKFKRVESFGFYADKVICMWTEK